jgi:hypothetical protein
LRRKVSRSAVFKSVFLRDKRHGKFCVADTVGEIMANAPKVW